MDANDRVVFEGFMDDLADVFQVSDARLGKIKRAYFRYLEDIDIGKLDRGVQESIRTLDSFPTINKLRTLSRAHDGGVGCRECARRPTEDHIREIACREYEASGRDIPWTLERVYQHANTSFLKAPLIRLWAKRAIAEMEGCTTLPVHLQTEEQSEALAQALKSVGYDGAERPDLHHRARILSERAPWMEDRVYEILVEHQAYWEQLHEDTRTMANADPQYVPDDKLTAVAILSTEQILEAGQLLYRKINGMISQAILSRAGKPRSKEWTPEQRKEGESKLRAYKADQVSIGNGQISHEDALRINFNGKHE